MQRVQLRTHFGIYASLRQRSITSVVHHLGEQPTIPIVQAMLGATVVECILLSATVPR